MSLTAVMTCHNINKIKYPWRFAANSVMNVVDRFVFVDAPPHEDDTTEALLEYKTLVGDKVIVVTRDWPSYHGGLSVLTNYGARWSLNGWMFQVQGDEIFDENDHAALRSLDEQPLWIQGARFRFRHYCGDFHHTFPFVYQSAIRAIRKPGQMRFLGDSSEAGGAGEVVNVDVTVHHVGKIHVGREEAGAFKEYNFQTTLYRDLFEVDPLVKAAHDAGRINYWEVFASAVEKGEVTGFDGPWPVGVVGYARSLGVELEKI